LQRKLNVLADKRWAGRLILSEKPGIWWQCGGHRPQLRFTFLGNAQ